MVTREQAVELILANYGDWSHDDPEWWRDMIEILTEYETVEAAQARIQ